MKPIPSKIISIKDEGRDRKTITVLNYEIAKRAMPGQFVMVWIPGVDEIPMSLSHIGDQEISFTVHKVGEATEALHKMKVNEYIGIRGPYGKGFKEVEGRIMIVGGGTGMAPLMPLLRRIIRNNQNDIIVINGAKSVDEIIFNEELRDLSDKGLIKYLPATEDGSYGYKGSVITVLEDVLNKVSGKIDEIYVCGPELMIKKTIDIALKRGIHVQAAIERYMKCAIGICGSCTIDPLGLRVCIEGPVLPLETLVKITELGVYKRDSSGLKRLI
ncbi:MAG: dihydroorotate dehydrogenase electron transfer subunit [Candidatus Methanomethylicia archaeon]|nr:dihydroorotate dehydrogenase electron transfer subunit [Candidatus Methanomethylicia archaeon]MCX8169226.1 dihydroorotate dehydrogenase electron transfer subunit [Candidatus Methanomethylicia archaeon]MDW7988992.1 dihydroorotate dehydrogenase electron transfer subunit [Nitrososphaerota archaeon]